MQNKQVSNSSLWEWLDLAQVDNQSLYLFTGPTDDADGKDRLMRRMVAGSLIGDWVQVWV